MIVSVLKLGTTIFLVLFGINIIAMALVLWHHHSVTIQPFATIENELNTNTYNIFVFSGSLETLAIVAVTAWLICNAVAYLWITRQK